MISLHAFFYEPAPVGSGLKMIMALMLFLVLYSGLHVLYGYWKEQKVQL